MVLLISLFYFLTFKSFSLINGLSVDPAVVQIRYENENSAKMETQQRSRNISIVDDDFMLDGERLQIMSGSLHYFRLPAEYWQDRLRKLRAAGLNAVSTYVEWSYHEPEERQYTFDGDRDVVRFIQLAAAEGLLVLLRPGPYICGERDLGGLPYWLLGKYPNITLRTSDTDYITENKIWMNKLFNLLTPLLYGNGGPIILVQVENEYGSYDGDYTYKIKLRDILKEHVKDAALLYTTDGSGYQYIKQGAVKDTLTTIDFGPQRGLNIDRAFQPLRQFMPKGPLMNSEFYSGWLTHWGESFQQGSTEVIIPTLRSMLDRRININFYMFFGGSNFEFSSGANYDGYYKSDITSYDYDAPLSEAGDPTPKYVAIRNLLNEYGFEAKHLPTPVESLKAAYGPWSVQKKYGLLTAEGRSSLGKKYKDVIGSKLPTFESLRQRSGFMLYETTLNNYDEGLLVITKPRDQVYVFINNEFLGTISRINKIYSLPIVSKSNDTLALLVENHGRINFGHRRDIHDYKGILSDVVYNNNVLDGRWSITGFPLEVLPTSNSDTTEVYSGPVLYEGTFVLPDKLQSLDTYIDPTGWGKGFVWVNGHNLGRYWPTIGPQVTLYLPGVWLLPAPAVNRIQILEIENSSPPSEVQSISNPILNRTVNSLISL